MGDQVLKRVSSLLQVAFRSTDFVCRIGGDEFAVIMVDVTSDLRYTIQEKIDFVNTELSKPIDGMPQVSLSAGTCVRRSPRSRRQRSTRTRTMRCTTRRKTDAAVVPFSVSSSV